MSTNFNEHSQDKLPFQNKDMAEKALAVVQLSQQTLDLERKNIINKNIQEKCIVQEAEKEAEKNRKIVVRPLSTNCLNREKGGVIPVEAYTTIFCPTTSREMAVILKAQWLLIFFSDIRINSLK